MILRIVNKYLRLCYFSVSLYVFAYDEDHIPFRPLNFDAHGPRVTFSHIIFEDPKPMLLEIW